VRAIFERLRSRFDRVVGVHEQPERLAAAWALGLTIGFSPLIGLHTVLALLLALIFRLNKMDVFLGTLVVNPWTLPVYFPVAVYVGKRITGVRVPRFVLPRPEEVLHAAVWREHVPWLRSVLLAWGAGAMVLALIAGGVTFVVLRQMIRFHRRRRGAPAP